MKKILFVVVILALASAVFAGQAGPYLAVDSLQVNTINAKSTLKPKVKFGVTDGVTCTNTARSIAIYPFKGVAIAGVAPVTFPTGLFTSASTYAVIVNESGVTTTGAKACTVLNGSGNSCTVYTNTVAGSFTGIAVGY